MEYVLSANVIKSRKAAFLYDEGEWSGVRKIADRVCDDIKAVFGRKPELLSVKEAVQEESVTAPVLFGTVGKAGFLSKLDKAGLFSLSEIQGKREVYSFTLLRNVPKKLFVSGAKGEFAQLLLIAGSEKRGTVYGLFHLSEMLGVSPFIDWLDMKPAKLDRFTLEEGFHFVSKEPSVRFRGFFINDEWPAFGNFCTKNYGGFNAKVYAHVFELLLRLKGNYLWPAMWSAIFPNDGPGLENAILADELGVVMGASHHEPCCRQGEEYRYVRGKDSVYGDAWNFNTNEKGITRFWEDGLKRSGKFENVITVGMRGEADTAILGREATLADNIDLLRRVLKTQNGLIKKHVNKDLDQVPRMLALYKEVEPYFYGDETTPGLMGDPELEGVTLMLCDDNYGNLRTLPTPEMRAEDVSLIRVEPYKELPVDRNGFVGPIPEISAMVPYDNFDVFSARKLYVHNCGHALMSYVGYQRGYQMGYEAMADEEVRSFMLAGLRESVDGICAEYNADRNWLYAHVDDLLNRFTNKMLGDTIFRLGRDPMRKLAAEDRLVGAANLACKCGEKPVHLAWGIAAALYFDPEEDKSAQQLQTIIKEKGAEAAIAEVAGIQPGSLLSKLVLDAYAKLAVNRKALP